LKISKFRSQNRPVSLEQSLSAHQLKLFLSTLIQAHPIYGYHQVSALQVVVRYQN
jgi:hypothetical protein